MMRTARLFILPVALVLLASAALGQEEAAPAEAPPPAPLASLDQVQVQVWITETTENGLRELGTNLQYTRVVRGVEQNGTVEEVRTSVFNPSNPQFNVTMPVPDDRYFTTLRDDPANPFAGETDQYGGGVIANVISPGYGQIDAAFRGVEQKADVDLISKPEILVVDNGEAQIHAGGQVPYQNIAYNDKGVGQLKVTWQDIGVNLNLQPQILPNDTIKLNITELNVSDVVRFDTIRGIDLPVFANRSQTGEVLVENGQTLVIGGLSSRVIRKTERRVPILGRIPLLGMAFRGRTSEAVNSHLLIFVSTTIVNLRELSPEAERALTFWQDRRWENSERISKEIAFMQQEP